MANLVSSSPYGFSVQEESRNLLSQTLFYKNVSGLYINIVVFFIFEDSFNPAKIVFLKLFVFVETETVNGNCQINQIVARDVGIQRLFIEESDFPIALEDHCRIG